MVYCGTTALVTKYHLRVAVATRAITPQSVLLHICSTHFVHGTRLPEPQNWVEIARVGLVGDDRRTPKESEVPELHQHKSHEDSTRNHLSTQYDVGCRQCNVSFERHQRIVERVSANVSR